MGKDEKFIVLKECIIGFSNSVKMYDPTGGFSKSKFVMIEGPGIVLVECGP